MKFKIAVISLLTAVLAICLFTSYILIDKANKQFELQKLQYEIIGTIYQHQNPHTMNPGNQSIESGFIQEWVRKYNNICGID
ncbi:MAG: hypothetical protein HFF06_05400 [Oscillospiraceae bacterium]|jgi:hypothetical protein|nr:hypothetical protein [Oscillospiraceae bacterium]